MAHRDKIKTLSGTLPHLLFSPKGGIEGLLLKGGAKSIQLAIEQRAADAAVFAEAVGKRINARASADHSPKTRKGAHPVYKLDVITKIAGKAVKFDCNPRPITGVVAAIHYAKHGEPNGVILKSGEFVHTRPPGMKKLKLGVGSKVVAQGARRMTVLGTPLVEADEINGVTLA
jgi:hypothetical protein